MCNENQNQQKNINAETAKITFGSTEKKLKTHSRLLRQEKNNEITINSTAGGNV